MALLEDNLMKAEVDLLKIQDVKFLSYEVD